MFTSQLTDQVARIVAVAFIAMTSLGCSQAHSESSAGPADSDEYVGMSDASAAVALDSSLFIAASDEDSILRVYERSRGGKPLATFDAAKFLDLDPKKPEVDIEAAARRGNRIYWISSHGANKKGTECLNRHRLFATEYSVDDGNARIEFVGKPYKTLLSDMNAVPQLKKYRFADAAKLPPKEPGGLAIEGLASAPDGKLLIGLRNPLADNKAIVFALLNPDEVVAGKPARIGEVIELDLGGLAIRSMQYWEERKEYVILAGPPASGKGRIYRWSGKAATAPTLVENIDLKKWNPEACIIYPELGLDRVQILSDDGKLLEKHGGEARFRSGWVRF